MENFHNLVLRLGLNKNLDQATRRLYDDISSKYSNRPYHNLSHIGQCLDEFSKVRQYFSDPDIAEFALWMHDYIYETDSNKSKHNEEFSAKNASRILQTNSNIDFKRINSCEKFIISTKHNSIPESLELRLFMDIDMSILGLSKEEFNIYDDCIMKEYVELGKIPIKQFYKGRLYFLEKIKDGRYLTNYFENKYGLQRKQNIQNATEKYRKLILTI